MADARAAWPSPWGEMNQTRLVDRRQSAVVGTFMTVKSTLFSQVAGMLASGRSRRTT
jgi:hypothetical protein